MPTSATLPLALSKQEMDQTAIARQFKLSANTLSTLI
jgi:hypothetical protein